MSQHAKQSGPIGLAITGASLRRWLIGLGAVLVSGVITFGAARGVDGAREMDRTDQTDRADRTDRIDRIDRSEPAANVPLDTATAELDQAQLAADLAEKAPELTPAILQPIVAPAPQPAARVRVLKMEVTAYCACSKCCGPKAKGITASGKNVSYNQGRFVAADTDLLPFGSKLLIPGYHGDLVEVIDRGSSIKGNRLDVFFPSHEEALKWGRQTVMVMVFE